MNRTLMEHRIGSLERTIGDHEIHRLVPRLSDEDLIHACQLITSFDRETISCETLDFELDSLFDKYRESPVNLAV